MMHFFLFLLGAIALIFLMLSSWRFAASVGIVILLLVLWIHAGNVRYEKAQAAEKTAEKARYDAMPKCPPSYKPNPFAKHIQSEREIREAIWCRD